MYQADGDWAKAIEIAEKYDRMNLKTTYFKAARNYEITKDYKNAIYYYEKSETFRKEVPRMLIEAGEIEMLEKYINEK